MKIEDFITETFQERLQEKPVLVVYDPVERFRDICFSLSGDHTEVIDASGPVITARGEAMRVWSEMTENEKKNMLIYIPRQKPLKQEQRLTDPFLPFCTGGNVFPEGTGDEYKSLCKNAFPDKTKEIEELFNSGVPEFDTVNALEGGTTWPLLETLLEAKSPSEICTAFLSPTKKQLDSLTSETGWTGEAEDFFTKTLGLALDVQNLDYRASADAVWRYLLFSEFVFDLPCRLPEVYADIPRAEEQYKDFVYTVCANLRTRSDTKDAYIEAAEAIEKDLRLPERMKDADDLGRIETFPFENITAFRWFIDALGEKDIERAEKILETNKKSIWLESGAEHQSAWTLARNALELITECSKMKQHLTDQAPENGFDFIDAYCSVFYYADSLYLRYSQTLAYFVKDDFFGIFFEPISALVQKVYTELAGMLNERCIAFVQKEGWPVPGTARQSEIFNTFIAPLLGRNEKVAFFMIDALRFDLAQEIAQKLDSSVDCTVDFACAQLPTKTEVGMGALLPEAHKKQQVHCNDGRIDVFLDSNDVSTPQKREQYFRSIYGDRCYCCKLDELLAFTKRKKLKENVQLLVVRSREIDLAGENAAGILEQTLPGLIRQLLKGIYKAGQLGIETVVVAADHGLIRLPGFSAGYNTKYPAGDWAVSKERFLLGTGEKTSDTVSFHPGEVGIPCREEQYVIPKTLSSFVSGSRYFHGGISLQEAVVPVLTVNYKQKFEREKAALQLTMTYRGTVKGVVKSRMMMIELSCTGEHEAGHLDFSEEWAQAALEIQLLVEEKDTGNTVGKLSPNDHLDPATGLIRIRSGEKFKVPVQLHEGFHGGFTVKAVEASTVERLGLITLETDLMD